MGNGEGLYELLLKFDLLCNNAHSVENMTQSCREIVSSIEAHIDRMVHNRSVHSPHDYANDITSLELMERVFIKRASVLLNEDGVDAELRNKRATDLGKVWRETFLYCEESREGQSGFIKILHGDGNIGGLYKQSKDAQIKYNIEFDLDKLLGEVMPHKSRFGRNIRDINVPPDGDIAALFRQRVMECSNEKEHWEYLASIGERVHNSGEKKRCNLNIIAADSRAKEVWDFILAMDSKMSSSIASGAYYLNNCSVEKIAPIEFSVREISSNAKAMSFAVLGLCMVSASAIVYGSSSLIGAIDAGTCLSAPAVAIGFAMILSALEIGYIYYKNNEFNGEMSEAIDVVQKNIWHSNIKQAVERFGSIASSVLTNQANWIHRHVLYRDLNKDILKTFEEDHQYGCVKDKYVLQRHLNGAMELDKAVKHFVEIMKPEFINSTYKSRFKTSRLKSFQVISVS